MPRSLTRLIIAGAAACAVAATAGTASATVIVQETFASGWTAGTKWALSGSYTPNVVTVGGQTPADALRLTPTSPDTQTGTISYTLPQPTSAGIDVRFTSAQWGGGSQGDGLSFFLRKGSDPSNAPGGTGGALGYAPIPSATKAGMPGGLLGVGLDLYGNYAASVVDGSGCPAAGSQRANRISVRGPGNGTTGYCLLGITNPGDVVFNGGGTDRTARARAVRITVDPASTPDPRVKVYYADISSNPAAPLVQVLDIPAPAELEAEPTFKFGFSAATGGATNNNEVWNVEVDSLTELSAMSITTTSVPNGTVGTAYTCTPIVTSNGVAPITYAVTSGSLPSGLTLDSTTGEICGTPTEDGSRTFTVTATDSRGPTASTTSHAYTLEVDASTAPCAPEHVTATGGNGNAHVSWKANATAGCSHAKTYEVESSTGHKCTVTAPTLTCTVPGLTPGTPVRFRVRASNAAGNSPWSSWSNEVDPTGAVVDPSGNVATKGAPVVTSDAIIVNVATKHAGTITVKGSSRVSGKWVTRCTGSVTVPGATLGTKVACVLNTRAQALLCKAPMTVRLVTTLTQPGRTTVKTTKTIKVAKRKCAIPVVG